jgi:hypothetical protein
MIIYLPYNLVRGPRNEVYKVEAYFWEFVENSYRRVLLVKKAKRNQVRGEQPRSGRILPRLRDSASQVRELAGLLRDLEGRVAGIEESLRLQAAQALLAYPVGGARLSGEDAEQLFAYRLLKHLLPSLKSPLHSFVYEPLRVRVGRGSIEVDDRALSLLYRIDGGVKRELERIVSNAVSNERY